ncbi:hypothetical protein GCM10025734_74910 [Kitasatospora paranensis]
MADRRTAIMEAAARVIARRGVRGLRVEELAAEAGVSTALIYYHFKDRAGILRATLEFINDRAARYTTERGDDAPPLDARGELEQTLLLEFQDTPDVRENSTAWGSCGQVRCSIPTSARTWRGPRSCGPRRWRSCSAGSGR